jgi:hypothetical protein
MNAYVPHLDCQSARTNQSTHPDSFPHAGHAVNVKASLVAACMRQKRAFLQPAASHERGADTAVGIVTPAHLLPFVEPWVGDKGIQSTAVLTKLVPMRTGRVARVRAGFGRATLADAEGGRGQLHHGSKA